MQPHDLKTFLDARGIPCRMAGNDGIVFRHGEYPLVLACDPGDPDYASISMQAAFAVLPGMDAQEAVRLVTAADQRVKVAKSALLHLERGQATVGIRAEVLASPEGFARFFDLHVRAVLRAADVIYDALAAARPASGQAGPASTEAVR